MLSARGLRHGFGRGPDLLREVALDLAAGEVVGLGGASGSGKSTLGRLLAGRLRPRGGALRLDGAPLLPPAPGRPHPVQLAPQAPELAVDPRWTVRRLLANAGAPDPEAAAALGLRAAWADRRPAELSGGELARVSLARLLHPGLRVLVCDEVTAQLDPLAQAGLWSALLPLAARRGIALLVISHDARLRSRLCGRDLWLEAGRLEAGAPT